jgi:aminoglycoside 6'-N-acetyltransferase I
MTDFRIVALTDETAHHLDAVAEGVFDNEIVPASRDAFIASDNHHMFLAVAEGQVVGMISGVVYLHPDKPRNMWINEVGTGDAWLRRGIATALMKEMLELAERLECEEAWLGTESDNRPALALYHALDAVRVEEFVGFTWDTEPD